jgi:predicted DNA-binding transcriptional regulator AlpA
MPEPIRLHEPRRPGRKEQFPGGLPADLAGARLIDREQFQKLLGIGRATFERWLAQKRLPEPIRLSRTCHRWRWAVVEAFLRDGCPAPQQAEQAKPIRHRH